MERWKRAITIAGALAILWMVDSDARVRAGEPQGSFCNAPYPGSSANEVIAVCGDEIDQDTGDFHCYQECQNFYDEGEDIFVCAQNVSCGPDECDWECEDGPTQCWVDGNPSEGPCACNFQGTGCAGGGS